VITLQDSIACKKLVFGPNFPIFSNVQLLDFDSSGELTVDFDVQYAGGFNLLIEVRTSQILGITRRINWKISSRGTQIVLRLPKTSYSMPVSFSVTLESLSGKVRLHSSFYSFFAALSTFLLLSRLCFSFFFPLLSLPRCRLLTRVFRAA
jgi:hypothetical protein